MLYTAKHQRKDSEMKLLSGITTIIFILSTASFAAPHFSNQEIMKLYEGEILTNSNIQEIERVDSNGRTNKKLKRLDLTYHGLHEFDCVEAGPLMADYNDYSRLLGIGVQKSIYKYRPEYGANVLYLDLLFGVTSYVKVEVPHGEGVFPLEIVDESFKGMKGVLELEQMGGRCLFTLSFNTEFETILGTRILGYCANRLVPNSFKELLLNR